MQLLGLYTGTIQRFGTGTRQSAIDKQDNTQPLLLTKMGLVSDQQADKVHHGGTERALCHYPHEHYRYWQQQHSEQAPLFKVAGFGENCSTTGMTEDTIYIGDCYRLGQAVIQVSQPRKPCWKLNQRFSVPTMAKETQDTGYTGWLYRVLEEGEICVGDTFTLLERPQPELSIAQIIKAVYSEHFDKALLAQIVNCEVLSENWRGTAQRRYQSGQQEDASARLLGEGL